MSKHTYIMANVMASNITDSLYISHPLKEAIWLCCTVVLYSSFKFMYVSLYCCVPVTCKLNMCVYTPLVIIIWCLSSLCSSNAGLKYIESDSYLYNLYAGDYQCYDEFKTI